MILTVDFIQLLMTSAFYLSIHSYLESLDNSQLSTFEHFYYHSMEFKFTIDCVFFVTTYMPCYMAYPKRQPEGDILDKKMVPVNEPVPALGSLGACLECQRW